MRIKSYETKRFAGLKDVDLEFSEGLNVILGPNESGKSTMVDGIHSTLFKNIRLRKNNNSDKDFTFKYMPKPSGDYIDGRVILEIEGQEYEIHKEWGSKEGIELINSDGNILKDEKDINDHLSKLMGYGESTYTSIVFAKQRDLKMALNNIIENSEITDQINDLLRKTMMELEGVSIDKLQKDIEDEIEELYKRWDRDKNAPQNNRGINNPYKAGLGRILESYYKKEKLLLSMEEVEKSEREFEDICRRIRELEASIDPLKEKRANLEEIEDDVNQRSIIEIQVEAINRELQDLMDANKNWPRAEQALEYLNEKEIALKDIYVKLEEEKKDIEKSKEKIELDKMLKDVEEVDSSIEKNMEELSSIVAIESKDIDRLSELKTELLTLETTMKAGKMIGQLNKQMGKEIYVVKDFGEREVLEENLPFEANGIINIIYEDHFELEVKTGDIDFKDLNSKYEGAKEEFEKLLEKFSIANLAEAKLELERKNQVKEEVKALRDKREYILKDITREELEGMIRDLSDIKVFRELEEIESLLDTNRNDELEVRSKKISEEEKIKAWEEKYSDHDNLFNLIIDRKTSLKEKESDLESLKPMPEEFNSPEEFREKLSTIKEELRIKEAEREELRPVFFEAKANVSDLSFEEISKDYKDAENIFNDQLKRGEKFLEIQAVFLKTKEEISNNPMESLVDEFARLLELITEGDYKKGEIDEEFNIKLTNSNGEIPIELLSAGTYDSVALALRFSLLKHIFEGQGGYVVLDDCLVDLDPERKLQSAKLINDFAENYQVIFTTCDPKTAEMLGGNIIEM